MTLLARHPGELRFSPSGQPGATLCEAFPAAQLRHWSLPHAGYNGVAPETVERRFAILRGLCQRGLQLSPEHENICYGSADALDSLVCLYAAAAVAGNNYLIELGSDAQTEGHIAVHA